jgi:hypothetical protein
MKINTSTFLSLFFCYFASAELATAQNSTSSVESSNTVCGTTSPSAEWELEFQKQIVEYKKEAAKGQGATYTIPIVIHLLYNGNTEAAIGTKANLHPDQIKAQMEALNEVFAGNTPGNSSLPSIFANVDANDVGITFCLAKKDKNGNTMAEPGVDRLDWKQKGWTDPGSFNDYQSLVNHFDGTIKPQSIWDPTKYLNVWLGDFNAGTGYATFPAASTLTGISGVGTSTTDGVFVSTKIFGCKTKYPSGYYFSGGWAGDYIEGDITAHEIGHWLGLKHIWGDATCGNDYCNDTPPQENSNQVKCPQHPYKNGTCSGNTTGEMFQNYMGYTQDACMCLFTDNQKTRMLTAMANGTYRKLLGTHGLCDIGSSVSNQTDISPTLIVSSSLESGWITLSFNAVKTDDYTVEIKNILGQTLYTDRTIAIDGQYSKQINLSESGSGIYFVELISTHSILVKKIIIK